MITNRDIELAFVRAQNRINEELENVQTQFILPDLIEMVNTLATSMKKNRKPVMNENNPLANEEI